MVATMIDLPPDLRDRLAERARESGRHEADIVRDALKQFLGSEAEPQSLSVGMIDDPDLSGADSED